MDRRSERGVFDGLVAAVRVGESPDIRLSTASPTRNRAAVAEAKAAVAKMDLTAD